MAETAVALVVDKLASLLSEGVEWLRVGSDLRRQVMDIKDELESIQCFLRDADRKSERTEDHQHINGSVETWVKQVRQVAYKIEDVIDQYTRQSPQQQHGGFTKYISKISTSLHNFNLRKALSAEIKQIKATLREVKERSDRYGFSSRNNSEWQDHDPRVASHFISAGEVVGIDLAVQELIGSLKDDQTNRKVISVVGMGGIGKTTLAKLISNNQEVKEHFELRGWITVSQTYNKEELLRILIRQFSGARGASSTEVESIGTSEEIQLISKLRKCLHKKRYMIVFDDVWEVKFWSDIELALPDDNVGSRIMITTRNENVSSFCKKSCFTHVHNLQPLDPKSAWELFCKKTFQFEFEGQCPQVLEEFSLEILERCKGLPLAIVVIAGLLSTKEKTAMEWKNLCERLQSELECDPHLANITKILALSYHDLPYHLQSCILYFGIFPEDYFVLHPRMTRHWIAEGFVKPKKGRTLEQVAEEYLKELLQRNMIQRSHKGTEADQSYEVHDLMRGIIVSRIEKLGFCRILQDDDTGLDGECRRLSVHNNIEKFVDRKENYAVRSVFIFNVQNLPKSFMKTLFKSCKLLKVLDFEGAPLDHLPENVGDLLHLRSLSLRATKIKNLPKSLGKLINLQNLNVQETLVQELGTEICNLVNLRHLLCGCYNYELDFSLNTISGVKIHKGIGALQDLQSLVGVEAANDGIGLMEELKKLRQLRKLCLTNLTAQMGIALCAAIAEMNKLEVLDLCAMNEGEVLALDSISTPPQFLAYLSLRGRLEKLPNWISQLPNMAALRLYFSGLIDDPLRALQCSPSLVHLYLYETYIGEQMHVEEGGFLKLKVLRPLGLRRLSTLIVESGALPLLEELTLGPSPHLEEVPSGIKHMVNLKTLEFRDMPKPFVLKMLPAQGQEYMKVKDIRDVFFSYKTRGVHVERFKLGSPKLLEHLQI